MPAPSHKDGESNIPKKEQERREAEAKANPPPHRRPPDPLTTDERAAMEATRTNPNQKAGEELEAARDNKLAGDEVVRDLAETRQDAADKAHARNEAPSVVDDDLEPKQDPLLGTKDPVWIEWKKRHGGVK